MPHSDHTLPEISRSSFDAIIFDLGGVILPLFPQSTVDQLSRLFDCDASVVYTQTKQVGIFDEFERGELSPDAFRERMCELFDQSVPATDLDRAWNAMLGSLPAEHLEFLRDLKKNRRTFLLSNTNAVHISCFLSDFTRDHGNASLFSDCFEQVHYSHELGMRKPETRIFLALIERHALNPTRTLFLDDNRDNVEAALSVGLRAIHHPTNAPLIERFVP